MIKRIFQCDSIPLSILSVVITIGIFIGATLLGVLDGCTFTAEGTEVRLYFTGVFKYILIGILLVIIPIGYRRSMGQAGILDINERVSLYPVAMVMLTVLPSCNNLLFLVASGLILLLFSRVAHIKEGESCSPAAFGGGLIIALCTWISPYFLILAIFLWLGLSTLSTMTWRAVIWSLIGLASPIYLYFTLTYIVSGTLPEFTLSGLTISDPVRLTTDLGLRWIIYLVVFIALFILMIFRSARAAGKGIVIRRKLIRLGIILLIITALISALIFRFEGASPYMSLMAIPMAIIFQEMYRTGKAVLYSVAFLLWVVLTVVVSWM